MFKEIFASIILATSISTPTLKQPKNLNYEDINQTLVQGNYCFNNTYDPQPIKEYVDSLGLGPQIYYEVVIDFNVNIYNYENQIVYGSTVYNLSRLQLRYYTAENSKVMRIYFDMYDISSTLNQCFTNYDPSYDINDLEDFDDGYPTGDTIFRLNNSYLLTKEQYLFFNAVFNKNGNELVRTYNGYYNMVQKSTTNIRAFGPYMMNNAMYTNLFSDNITETQDSYWYTTTQYDAYYQTYMGETITERPSNPNIYLSGVMMTNTSYQRMSTAGVFGYVQPQAQATEFEDLFFTLADTPIYFLASLFNWQLFGTNLFIALSGLLTLCLILVLVRKFW